MALDPYIIEGWDINASTANGIRISNTNAYFIIRNINVHSGWSNFHSGVVLSHVVNGQVENSVSTTNYSGIWLNYSAHIQVSNNQLFQNSIGPNFGVGALNLDWTNDTIVRNNNITNSIRYAILVYASKNVSITGNTASQSGGIASIGVSIDASTNLTVVDNTISYSTHLGMLLDYSTRVHVYHNNFVANYPNAQEIGGSGNSWDNGYPSGGNYWDDYWYYFLAEDNCSGPSQNICTGPDGIGDIPYVLQTGQQDRYPLAVHDGAVLSVQAPSSVGRGKTVLINVTIQNLGNVLEKRFTVTLSFGSTLIGSQTLTDFSPCGAFSTIPPYCSPRQATVLTFSWNTGVLLENGVPPGTYVLTATVNPLPLETVTSNNSKSSNPVQVLGFPSTPLALLEGVGPLLTLISEIASVGVIVVFLVFFLLGGQRKLKTGSP